MINFYIKYKIEIFVFLLALFARTILFSINLNNTDFNVINAIHGDDGYYEISKGILAGKGFTGYLTGPYHPDPLRPPVWPFLIAFIAGIFGTYWAVVVFEILIGSLIPVLGLLIVRRLFLNQKIALGTGILMALEPYSVLLSSLLYSETMFTFLFLVFFYFLVKYFGDYSMRNLVWMSVFLGLATMTKLTIQYVPIVLAITMIFVTYKLGQIKWKDISIMLSIFCFLIIPWVCRNYVEYGKLGLSAQPAFNLYVYLVPTVLSIDNHTSFSLEHQKFVRKGNFDENSINLSNADYYSSQAIKILKDHKFAIVKSVCTTLITFFTHDGLLTVFQNAGIVVNNTANRPVLSLLLTDPLNLLRFIFSQIKGWGLFILLARIVWIAVTLLMFIGIFKYLRNERLKVSILIALFIVAYFALTTAINGFGVNARFKVPVEVFIFAFALYGLFSLKRDNVIIDQLVKKK